jgi:hypothetical protein
MLPLIDPLQSLGAFLHADKWGFLKNFIQSVVSFKRNAEWCTGSQQSLSRRAEACH